MKKILFLLCLYIHFFALGQSIEGEWSFNYILPDSITQGENLKPISSDDKMFISNDGTFHYKIKKANLHAKGNWKLEENLLILDYNSPEDTIRSYSISLINESLILNENRINYAFVKNKVRSIGFSISSFLRGVLGILTLIFIAYLFSKNRKEIDWKLVFKGLAIQILFAILILKVPFVSKGFEFIGKIFTKIISFTQDGTMFLFSSFDSGIIESPLMNFVVMILPTVIFFSTYIFILLLESNTACCIRVCLVYEKNIEIIRSRKCSCRR